MHNCITTREMCIPCDEHTNHSKDVYLYSILHWSNSTIRPNNWEVDITKSLSVFCYSVAWLHVVYFILISGKGEGNKYHGLYKINTIWILSYIINKSRYFLYHNHDKFCRLKMCEQKIWRQVYYNVNEQ